MTKWTLTSLRLEWFFRLYNVMVGTKKWSPGDSMKRLQQRQSEKTPSRQRLDTDRRCGSGLRYVQGKGRRRVRAGRCERVL